MVRSGQWIFEDQEWSEVHAKQLWKNYHTQEDEVKKLEHKLGLATLEEVKEEVPVSNLTPSDKTSKLRRIDDIPPEEIVDPLEHTQEQIKEHKIVKAKRIQVEEDQEEEKIDTTNPKRDRKKK
jgi:lipopolysaccharide biosynthesis glycosyltransferase